MPSRYQTIFTIIGREQSGLSLLNEVRAFVLGRVSEQYGEPELATTDEGEWESENGHLRVDSDQREGVGFFSMSWMRNDGWNLRWRLATLKGELEADVQVSGPDGDPRPAGPPGALDEVLKRYTCRIQGYDMWDVVQGISKENADWYADSVIFNPERRIPVVAISPAGILEGSARFPRAQMLLRGIAAIAVPTGYDLSVINGKLGRLACSGGEVRVYQPGATREDNPSLHRRWRPNEVDWGDIRDECMHILALSRGPRIYHEVREEIVRLWEEDQPEENLGSLSSSAQIRGLESELAEERDAKSRAEAERDDWRNKHETLDRNSTRDIERLKKNVLESDNTIVELLAQINSPSSAESVIPHMRSQNAELHEERDSYKRELDTREDQSEDVARLTRERDSLSNSLEKITKERDAALVQLDSDGESSTTGLKRGQRKAEAEHRKEIEKRDDKIDGLDLTVRQKDTRIVDLERMVSELTVLSETYGLGRENIRNYDETPSPDDGEPNEGFAKLASKPKSVIEVVRELEGSRSMRFLETAYESAKKSPYQRFDVLEQTIMAISECGVLRAKGSLGQTLESWFQENHKVDYRPRESETTGRKHPRIWRDDECGNELNMEEHITLGGGGNRDPKNVLRIHMAWCDKEKLWVIGHVGRHLDVGTS